MGPMESSGGNWSTLAGSTEPQFTPTRMAQSLAAATSARYATLSRSGRRRS